MYKLTTSPSVPVPDIIVLFSNTVVVVIATGLEDLAVTTTVFENGLKAKQVLDAFAVIDLPTAIFTGDNVQVPFAKTVVVTPKATPLSKTVIVVPGAAVDVPETLVMGSDEQIGPLTVGAGATGDTIDAVAISELHNVGEAEVTSTL